MRISDAQNQRFNVVLWLTAALSSNTWGVMCHFQTNNPFSYRLGSSSAKVKPPVQHQGCWKHTTAPLFWEFLLEWTRLGLRLLFSFSCCSWGSFFPSSYSSLDFIAHTLGDDFVNETMHILAAFMMVMTSSGGTMEGECWDPGVMVVGNRGGACECLFVCVSDGWKTSYLQNVNSETTALLLACW